MDAYIEFRNVVKKFDDFVALDHVSLQIPKGAFVTLLGPSGCGKTTLMRQLAGFSEPEEGDVLVDGKRMNGLPPFKRNTPLVFQEYALFPHMTVYENISYGLKLKKAPKEEKDRKVAEMLEMFNLQGLDGRAGTQLIREKNHSVFQPPTVLIRHGENLPVQVLEDQADHEILGLAFLRKYDKNGGHLIAEGLRVDSGVETQDLLHLAVQERVQPGQNCGDHRHHGLL